jgi:phage shock protein PspC (stress-responsive transcriptional regulator)
MDGTKPCPYCGEEIRAEAIRCRYCRSRLTSFDAERWHRSHPDARWAGVCAALAHSLAVPVAAVRLLFVVFTFFHLLGPLLYGSLWLVIPWRPGEESLLERLLRKALDLAAMFGGRHHDPPAPPSAWEHPSA